MGDEVLKIYGASKAHVFQRKQGITLQEHDRLCIHPQGFTKNGGEVQCINLLNGCVTKSIKNRLETSLLFLNLNV